MSRIKKSKTIMHLTYLVLVFCALSEGRVLRRYDGRIVGGEDVDIKEYPYQLALMMDGFYLCGASIISDEWALTAGHCVAGAKPKSVTLRTGSTNKLEGGTVFVAEELHVHPKNFRTDWDIALIKISGKFPLGEEGTDKINLVAEEPADSEKCVVSGWGAADSPEDTVILKAVEVPIVDRNKCDEQYKGLINERMICAGYDVGGKDACGGDSGGPLVSTDTKEQVGIVSWGYGCGDPQYPGVYTNVAHFRSWIKEVSGV